VFGRGLTLYFRDHNGILLFPSHHRTAPHDYSKTNYIECLNACRTWLCQLMLTSCLTTVSLDFASYLAVGVNKWAAVTANKQLDCSPFTGS
jgi:hypothetical protein